MKALIKKWVHGSIAFFHCEPIFIFLARRNSVFRKLIPDHTSYREGSFRNVVKAGVKYRLDISDYMQWYLFVDLFDISASVAIQYIRSGSAVLDIGSNVGHFCLPIAEALDSRSIHEVEIHAIEPNPRVFGLLKENTSLNKTLTPMIQLHPLALGAIEEKRNFVFGGRNSGAGRFANNERADVMVNVMTLQSFCAAKIGDRKISFIKIDVEGYEPEVFDGGWLIIQSHRPVIFFEFSPAWYRERGVPYTHVLDKLSALNYKLLVEQENLLVSIPDLNIGIDRIYQTNILALPN